MKFILARKLNMTQLFTEDGKVVPVTVLFVEPNKISRIRTQEKDGYEAVQVEMGKKKREFRVDPSTRPTSPASELAGGRASSGTKTGEEIQVSQFEPGEQIDITGISKGRGFAGAVKRHGFHGAPASHGHDHPRAVGSIGQRFPQHVRPGLRMAGHMGAAKSTVKHSMIVAVEPTRNLLFVKGGVPGAPGTLIKIKTTGKKKEIGKVVEYGVKNSPPHEGEKEGVIEGVAHAAVSTTSPLSPPHEEGE